MPDRRFHDRSAPRWAGLLAAAAVTAAVPSGAVADVSPADLQPYKARYQVTFRGLNGGQIESSMSRGPVTGQWLYQTRAFPSLLGRVAVSPLAHERSTMQVTTAGVRPLTFDFNDGSASSNKDVNLRFDWSSGRVSGSAEGVRFEFPVQPGTQDTASVQAAMLIELLAGRSPHGFPIVTGNKLREYRYWQEGKATVSTPLGQFETVVWANQRDGSTRVTKAWHAPALGYLPVQAVQFRNGKAETQMKLIALERGQGTGDRGR